MDKNLTLKEMKEKSMDVIDKKIKKIEEELSILLDEKKNYTEIIVDLQLMMLMKNIYLR